MSNNLEIWNKVKQPPTGALKQINFGYLKGKSDINPQWRIMAMTQAFGMVGHGWTYRIVRTWSEEAADKSVMCFAEVAVKTKHDGVWGEEFSGIGGSEIVELAKGVPKANDEGYKKAVTDALGVAFKAVGVAADIYFGNYDGSKYLSNIDNAYHSEDELVEKFEVAKKRISDAKTTQQLATIFNEFAQTSFMNQIKELCGAKRKELENAQ